MFLQIPTKNVLVEEDMLPYSMYTQEELDAYRAMDSYFSWSPLGVYHKVPTLYVDDIDSETTAYTANRSDEDFKTAGEWVNSYIVPIDERKLS